MGIRLGPGCGCCGGCLSCIPNTNLTMTIAGMIAGACSHTPYDGTYTMLHTSGSSSWAAQIVPAGQCVTFGLVRCSATLFCVNNQIGFSVSWSAQLATTSAQNCALTSTCLLPITVSCSPFQVVIGPPSTCCVATDCYNWTSITITP